MCILPTARSLFSEHNFGANMRSLLLGSALFLLTFLPSLSWAQKPAGLMVDLVKETSVLYQKGYPVNVEMRDLSDADIDKYQFAEIRSSRPTFSWIVPQGKNATWQKSYEIAVDDSWDDALLRKGGVWHSGKVKSRQSTAVEYGGEELQTDKTYFWSVRVATNDGRSGWSDIQTFHTAKSLKPYAVSYRPLMREKECPKTITRIDERTTFIDFGKASFASLELTLECDKERDTIFVAIGEDALDGRVNPKPHGTVRYYRYPLVLRKGRHSYPVIPVDDTRNTGPQAVLVPDYLDQVAPMRYCQIDGYGKPIEPQDIVRHTTVYSFDYNAARFYSNNAVLNKVWELCKYTIKATSAFGVYVDGDRERIPYEADALINQLCHYTTDREYAMARRTSEYLLEHPTWPTEWILQALIIAWNDYLYTGDRRSIEANYEILKARTLLSLKRENGLISTTDDMVKSQEFRNSIRFGGDIRDIVDWPRCGDWPHGEDDHYHLTAYNTVVNAFHYRALVLLQQMAELIGKVDEAAQLQNECEALHKAFNKLLFDEEKGVYRDGVDSEHISLHANLFPLALGLVEEENVPRVMEYIRSRGLVCSVYAAQFLMDAIYQSGDGDYGLKMLIKEDERGWYNMVRHNATITYEAWDDKFKNNQDWNHAWGAAPANIIPRWVVGVRPLEAGWSKMVIAPQIADLKLISAAVPTIKGEVKVDINSTTNGYGARISIPANTEAMVVLPVKAEVKELRVNGKKRAIRYVENGDLDCGTMGSGDYLFSVSYK